MASCEIQVRTEIADSQIGSDVYGLVEKMAFHYHLRDRSRSNDDNWLMAIDNFGKWCEYQVNRFSNINLPLEDSIHNSLCSHAYEHSQGRDFSDKEGSSLDDWIYAQNELAKQVMHQVTIF